MMTSRVGLVIAGDWHKVVVVDIMQRCSICLLLIASDKLSIIVITASQHEHLCLCKAQHAVQTGSIYGTPWMQNTLVAQCHVAWS